MNCVAFNPFNEFVLVTGSHDAVRHSFVRFSKTLNFCLSLDGCVVGHSTTEEETALVHITSSKFTLSLDCCLFLSIVVVHLLRLV